MENDKIKNKKKFTHGVLNIEEYKKRLKLKNPVTMEKLGIELKVLIKEVIKAAT